MRELNIIAEYTMSKDDRYRVVWKRYYARLDTAIPRATCFGVLGALKPGESIVFSHRLTGLHIGSVKMRVGNRIEVKWIWDDK